MVRGLMRRAFRKATGGADPAADAAAERPQRRFELISARLGERDVVVFVDQNGVAIGAETTGEHTSVLTGLGAGVLLSDVEAARAARREAAVFRLDQVTPRAADALIDGMTRLPEAQRAALRTALAL